MALLDSNQRPKEAAIEVFCQQIQLTTCLKMQSKALLVPSVILWMMLNFIYSHFGQMLSTA
jgi:hypothetical protein